MDTQDKQSNNIFIQSILPMSFFNGHTGQTDKQRTYSKHFLPRCFYNGHTGQTDKQHIYSKYSIHVFLIWSHRTNGLTTYLLKGLYPCLFRMVTQDKQSNNSFAQRILSTHVFLEWTDRTNGQTTYLFKVFCPCLFLMDTQDKRSNNIFTQRILPMSF